MKFIHFKPVLPTIEEETEAPAAVQPQLPEVVYPGGPASKLLFRAMALPPYPGGPPSKLPRQQVCILIHSRTFLTLISFILCLCWLDGGFESHI